MSSSPSRIATLQDVESLLQIMKGEGATFTSRGESREEWTSKDDCILLIAVEWWGKRWRKVSSHFDNRSESSVRNRYKRLHFSSSSNDES
jgi:hypothetical protein